MLKRISYTQAHELIQKRVAPLPAEWAPLSGLAGRVASADASAVVDSPSIDASLKDGWAVCSSDLTEAGGDREVSLRLCGGAFAGSSSLGEISRGQAFRVTTGARLPQGADAVLAGEFGRVDGDRVYCFRDAGPGRNVLLKGTDVAVGQVVVRRGETFHPAKVGLLAASGLDGAWVRTKPRVAVLGTGDEVVAPGRPLEGGKLYASNMVEAAAWLSWVGLDEVLAEVVPDDPDRIRTMLVEASRRADAIVTTGGAWGSERDFLVGLLDELGWDGCFHRVRLGPGKAVAFGLWESKPVFVLPGGPPSFEAAFLLLALPGILALMDRPGLPFPRLPVVLDAPIGGQIDWTQVHHAWVRYEDGVYRARPLKSKSRLSAMADKNALILLPEGEERIEAGRETEAWLLH
jgi:molybdopterin molybdotransferase